MIANSRSKTLASILAVFCLGILIGPLFLFVPQEVFLILIILGLSILFFRFTKPTRLIIFILLALLVGLWRYGQSEIPKNISTVQDHVGVATQVSGTVSSEVEKRISYQQLIIDDVSVAGSVSYGKVLLRAPLYPEVFYGNNVQFNCKLEKPEPFNGFAYDKFLQTKGVLAVCAFPQYLDVISNEKPSMIGMLLSLKRNLVHRLRELVPEPHASFLSGLVFGGSSSLSKDIKDDFARTGTSHILAASGFNVSLFSLIFLGWLLRSPLGRKKSLVLTVGLLFVYLVLAGATPAVLRATLMGLLVLASQWVKRKPYYLNLILLTAAFMLFINPRILLHDVGFQLSFAATIALITIPQKWDKAFSFIPNRLRLRTSFVASLAAIVVTLPIVLWHFGTISVVAPIVNLFVLPLVPYAMAIVLAMLAVSFVSGALGLVISLGAWAFSFIMLSIIHLFGQLNFALVEVEYAQILGSVIAVIIASFFLRKHLYKTSRS